MRLGRNDDVSSDVKRCGSLSCIVVVDVVALLPSSPLRESTSDTSI